VFDWGVGEDIVARYASLQGMVLLNYSHYRAVFNVKGKWLMFDDTCVVGCLCDCVCVSVFWVCVCECRLGVCVSVFWVCVLREIAPVHVCVWYSLGWGLGSNDNAIGCTDM